MISVNTKKEDDSEAPSNVNYTERLEQNILTLQQMALDISKQGRKDRPNWIKENKQMFNVPERKSPKQLKEMSSRFVSREPTEVLSVIHESGRETKVSDYQKGSATRISSHRGDAKGINLQTIEETVASEHNLPAPAGGIQTHRNSHSIGRNIEADSPAEMTIENRRPSKNNSSIVSGKRQKMLDRQYENPQGGCCCNKAGCTIF